jgi:hypothetical protein
MGTTCRTDENEPNQMELDWAHRSSECVGRQHQTSTWHQNALDAKINMASCEPLAGRPHVARKQASGSFSAAASNLKLRLQHVALPGEELS